MNNDTSTLIRHGNAPPDGLQVWHTLPDGTLHGVKTVWYPDGQQKRMTLEYRYGKRHGPCTAWYENGIVRTQGRFQDDLSGG